MKGLKETVSEAAEALSLVESRRETAISESRKIIRLSKSVIHSVHTGESYESDREEMNRLVMTLTCGLSDEQMSSGPVADALMEYTEAEILCQIVEGKDVLSFKEMCIPPQPWVLGLADVIGELRRRIVTDLMNGDIKEAKHLFACMEEICDELLMLDVPDAVLPVRRKQDVARSLVEKTRSDVLNNKN